MKQVPFERCTQGIHFDTEILIQFPTHYGPESHQVGFWTGVRYGFGILGSLLEYRLHKSRFVRLRCYTFGE